MTNQHASLDASQAPDCEQFALVLPRLDDPELDPDLAAPARAHLATCAACRADLVGYQRLDQALRRRYGPISVPPRRTEDIMQSIAERSSAAPRRSAPPRPPRRWRAALAGIPALAAVALIAVLAFLILPGRFNAGFNVASGSPQYSFPGIVGSIASLSMDAADDGWALGQTLRTTSGAHDTHEVTFYHYHQGTWTPTYVMTNNDFANSGISGFNGTISMDSPTDGWAVAHNFNSFTVVLHDTNGTWSQVANAPQAIATLQALAPSSVWAISGESASGVPNGILYYDGHTWTPQSLPLPASTVQANGSQSNLFIVSLQMQSSTEGWALASQGYQQTVVLRLHQGVWSQHSTFTMDPAGSLSSFGALAPLAMLSPTDGWALGQQTVADASGNTTHVPLKQIVLHYTNGAWHQVPLTLNGSAFAALSSIQMLSATNGWIVGIEQNAYFGATTSHFLQQPILFHYDGSSWSPVTVPATGLPATAITQLTFTPDGKGWAAGYVSTYAASDTLQDTDILAKASPLLLTYTNGAFQITRG